MTPRPALLLLLVLTATPLAAQELPRLGLEFGTSRYGAILHDDGSPQLELIPFRPTMVTLRFTGQLGKLGIGVSLGRSRMDFESSDGSDVTVLSKREASIWEFSPEVRFALVRTAAGGRIYAHAGLIFDKWHVNDLEDRSRMGFILGATAAARLAEGVDVDVRLDFAGTGAPFKDSELGTGVSSDPVRRGRLSVGLAKRL